MGRPKALPPRRRAPKGSTERLRGLSVKKETAERLRALAAAMAQAGEERANRSGALDLLVLQPERAAQLLGAPPEQPPPLPPSPGARLAVALRALAEALGALGLPREDEEALAAAAERLRERIARSPAFPESSRPVA